MSSTDNEKRSPVGSSQVQSPEEEVVDWDGPDDPSNPLNWSKSRKWTTISIVSAIAFNQAISTRILAPAIPSVLQEFQGTTESSGTLLVSIFVVGLAIGPLIMSPLSELYGRNPLMHISNVLFLMSSILCAVSTNFPMLLTFRLLQGMSSLSLGGGYVSDMMKSQDRSRAMNIWNLGPTLAPSLGPIIGGYIILESSWRWTQWLVSILAFVLSCVCFVFLRESYPPRLLELKARRLRKDTGNLSLRSRYGSDRNHLQLFGQAIVRPSKMLLLCPAVALTSLFLGIAYSYMFLLFTTFTQVFQNVYGFNVGEAGLSYLGLGIGAIFGQYALDLFMKGYTKRRRAENREIRSEDHLLPLLAGGIAIPIGLFWYGWSVEYRVHWIVPIVGTAVCGMGVAATFLGVLTYLVDAFSLYAASALAANTVVRCVFAGTIPLAGPPLYNALGLGWGNTLLGFLALSIIVPASILLRVYGERIRKNFRYASEL